MNRLTRLAFWRGRAPGFWRTFLSGGLVGVIVVAGIGALLVAPWLLTHRSMWPLERKFGNYAVSMAARLHGGTKSNPLAINRQALERGQYAYTGSCAQCHGATGDGTGAALSQALFPPATDLSGGDAAEKSDAELFWITKNGLSFTAMPGFAGQYNDDAIWALVAYLRALQGKQSSSSTSRPLVVPTPSAEELARAGVSGDPAAQGAAVYFAENCQLCHGGSGNGPGELRLRFPSQDDAYLTCVVRNGPNGMPAYSGAMLSDEDLATLVAFMKTLPTAQGQGGGEGRPLPGRPPGTPPAGGGEGRPGPGGGGGGRDAYSSPPGADTSACEPQRPGAGAGR